MRAVEYAMFFRVPFYFYSPFSWHLKRHHSCTKGTYVDRNVAVVVRKYVEKKYKDSLAEIITISYDFLLFQGSFYTVRAQKRYRTTELGLSNRAKLIASTLCHSNDCHRYGTITKHHGTHKSYIENANQ